MDRSSDMEKREFSSIETQEEVSSERWSLWTLSSAEQELLFRFQDRQLGFFGRIRAAALIRRNPEARRFCQECSDNSNMLRQSFSSEVSEALSRVDIGAMWNKIDAQIAQEQHAELLARRSVGKGISAKSSAAESNEGSAWSLGIGWGQRARWGLSGAAFGAVLSAASVVLVVSPNGTPFSVVTPGVSGEGLDASSSRQPGAGALGNGASSGFTPREISSSNVAVNRFDSFGPSRGGSNTGAPETRSVSLGSAGLGGSTQSFSRVFAQDDQGLSGMVASGEGSGVQSGRGPSSGYRPVGAQEYDLSDAIAEALAERARREASTRQPLMSLRQNLGIDESGDRAMRSLSLGRTPRAIEVDWMRSKGRVRMFHDPVEKAAYFWVKPSRSVPQVFAAQASSDAAAEMSAAVMSAANVSNNFVQ